MDVLAVTKYQRISCQKGQEVAREVQGLSASRALEILQFTPRKAARLLEKTLRSAIANAHEYNRRHNKKIEIEQLVVKEAQFHRGPQMRRWKAAARGRAAPRLRRTSHVRVVLSDGQPARSE